MHAWFTLCPNTSHHKNRNTIHAVADITLLCFDLYTCCACYRYPRDRECKCDRDVALFCGMPRVPWCQQPARPRIKVLQPAYSQRPSDKDPQAWISDGDSSVCGPSKMLTLMTVPLTHQGILVQKDDTAVAKSQTGWQSKM